MVENTKKALVKKYATMAAYNSRDKTIEEDIQKELRENNPMLSPFGVHEITSEIMEEIGVYAETPRDAANTAKPEEVEEMAEVKKADVKKATKPAAAKKAAPVKTEKKAPTRAKKNEFGLTELQTAFLGRLGEDENYKTTMNATHTMETLS